MYIHMYINKYTQTIKYKIFLFKKKKYFTRYYI